MNLRTADILIVDEDPGKEIGDLQTLQKIFGLKAKIQLPENAENSKNKGEII